VAGNSFTVVTLHPSVDRTYQVPNLHEPLVRGRQILAEPAGKGVNVARTLSRLGDRVTCIGFVGFDQAAFFRDALADEGVRTLFVTVQAPTRQNITLISLRSRKEMHVIDAPMRIEPKEAADFRRHLADCANAGGTIVFAGSLPRGIGVRQFIQWLRLARKRGARLCVDTQGTLLRATLSTRPTLIKPNMEELSELVGKHLDSPEDATEAAAGLLGRCEQVLLSLGRDGAILLTADGIWHAWEARPARPVSTVGCGDALLAGYLHADASGAKPSNALQFAVACGSACARVASACLPSADAAARLLRGIRVRQVHPAPRS